MAELPTRIPEIHAPQIRVLENPAELPAAAALFGAVWPTGESSPYATDLLRAVLFAGGYVAGAYLDDRLVGASLGILGRHDNSLVLHSHITGVLPGLEHAGIGAALKQHQRGWARHNDLPAITWTFDPLVRRNAWFNLGKLGARVVDYVEGFYGTLTDAINAGDETDRAIIWWPTADPTPGIPGDGFVVVDDVGGVHAPPAEAAVLNVHTPSDIVSLRATDASEARRWRHALREGFGGAIRAGFIATACTRDGVYTLEAPERPGAEGAERGKPERT